MAARAEQPMMGFMPALIVMWVLVGAAALGLLLVLAFLPSHEKPVSRR